MTTPSEPDQIRREIERTQASLSEDVDALTEKVTPGKIVGRRVDRARSTARGWKDKVMGANPLSGSEHLTSGTRSGGGLPATAHSAADQLSGTASRARDRISGAASSAAETASDVTSAATDRLQEAPRLVRRQAQGNPLAAGVIAFGAGWLISSLLPAGRQEQRLAEQAKDRAQQVAQPMAQQAQQVANEMRDNLREPAQKAAESVRSSATEGAQTVRDEAQNAKDHVQNQTRDATGTLRDTARNS